METIEQAVLATANRLVQAFARHDKTAYFAAFAPGATFIFHTLDRPLTSRAAYEDEWNLWEERDGFRVTACRSSEQNLQIFGTIAIFSHLVETDVTLAGEALSSRERETIVFSRCETSSEWLAVHEHLSKAA